jgi:hypothetical protein
MSNLMLKLVKELERPDMQHAYTPDMFVHLQQELPENLLMADALNKKVRGYKTAPKDSHSLWVYRPQDTYAMGWVTYADVFESGTGECRHAVYSPNIHNGKYLGRDNMFMSSTLSLDKAVRNASKYLRPLTTLQVLSQIQPEFALALGTAKDVAVREMKKVVTETDTDFFLPRSRRSASPFRVELDRILQSDYEFVDKKLKAQFIESLNAIKEYEEISKLHDSGHTFIEVVQSQGENVYRGFKDTVLNYSLFHFDDSAENKITYSQEELPENLLGAISVLSMVEARQYVSGVGYRAAENMFYVSKGKV